MANVDPLALIALLVSLVALIATTCQLLQQYVATADGYRRCLPSVMGRWGKMTKMKWRWREFRFETIFFVPSLSVDFFYPYDIDDTRTSPKIWDEEWKDLDPAKKYILGVKKEPAWQQQEEGKRRAALPHAFSEQLLASVDDG